MIGNDKTLRKVCKNYEQVENYNKAVADEYNLWDLHHRREMSEMKSKQQLIDEGKYYNVQSVDLIFLLHSEHAKLHHTNKIVSEETRNKMSKAQLGEKNHMFGKKAADDTKKKMSDSHKGEHWYNDGKVETRAKECPERFVKGRLRNGENHPMYGKKHTEDAKKKMSDSAKGKYWWNNNIVEIVAKECPGEDFKKGRLRK